MPTDREAMKMAIEALELASSWLPSLAITKHSKIDAALTALRKAVGGKTIDSDLAVPENEPSSGIEAAFERYADSGYALALVFDDDGRWAVSDSGSCPLPDSEVEGHTKPVMLSHYVKPEQWKPTIREALALYVAKHPLAPSRAQVENTRTNKKDVSEGEGVPDSPKPGVGEVPRG